LTANWASGVETCFLPLWHEAALVLLSYVSCQRRTVDENFETECAFLWLLVVFSLLVPVQVSLCLEHFSAMAEELFLWLHLPVGFMDFLMFREIAVPLEPFSTDIAFQRCLASVYPDMFSQFIGCEKLLVAIVALEGPVLKMPFLMLSQQVGLCKFLSTF